MYLVRRIACGPLWRWPSILGLLVAIGGSRHASAQQASVSTIVRHEVLSLLDSVVAAGRRGDTSRVRQLVSPDFRFIHSTGRVDTIPDFLRFLSTVRQDSTRDLGVVVYAPTDAAVLVVGHDATWVAPRGWAEFQSTDVVVRSATDANGRAARGGTWRWSLHQSTGLPTGPSAWVALPDSLLNQYVGVYSNPAGFMRQVKRASDRLTITAVGGSDIPYRALTPSSFHAERGDAYAVFVRDERGRIAYLEILQPSGAERFTRRRPVP